MSRKPVRNQRQNEHLRRENAGLLKFFYACPIGLVALDGEGTVTMMNPLAMQLVLPLARDRDVTNLFSVLEPYAPELRALISEFKPQQGTIIEGHRVFIGRGRGGDVDTVFAVTLVKLAANALVATLSDVSVQVAQEGRLRQAEAWFSSLIGGVEDFAALSLDAAGRIDHVNVSVHRHTGFAEHELIGHGLEILEAPDPASGVISCREQIELAARHGWHLDEGWCARHDGSRVWCQRLVSVCREEGDPEGRTILGFAVVLRAVTRQGADAGTLKRRLTTDHLTGAVNRAHFYEVAERQAARCRREGGSTAVVILDIDHFKRVNDIHGHAVGDEVLRAVVAACRSSLRPGDTLARIGGEEFVVLMPTTELRQGCEKAEQMRLALARLAIEAPQGIVGVTASFGCAVLDGPEADVAVALAKADAALYAAKGAGRDRVFPALDPGVAA